MVMAGDMEHWDAFVSHASEDKVSFVRPLVEALRRLGASLWYDEFSLRLGDRLSSSIDSGIAESRYGIVVVSPAFLEKRWPEAELRALNTRRIEDKLRLIPIWHNVGRAEVVAFSPMLADLMALQTAGRTAQDVALAVLAEIRPDLYESKGRSQLEKLATGKAFEELEEELSELEEELSQRDEEMSQFRNKVSELLCPTCEAPLVERIVADDLDDPNQFDIDSFQCGYVSGGHYPRACRHDPSFPALTDYELRFKEAWPDVWRCFVTPKTTAAKRHYLRDTEGSTATEAKNCLIEEYNRGAPPGKRVQLQS